MLPLAFVTRMRSAAVCQFETKRGKTNPTPAAVSLPRLFPPFNAVFPSASFHVCRPLLCPIRDMLRQRHSNLRCVFGGECVARPHTKILMFWVPFLIGPPLHDRRFAKLNNPLYISANTKWKKGQKNMNLSYFVFQFPHVPSPEIVLISSGGGPR